MGLLGIMNQHITGIGYIRPGKISNQKILSSFNTRSGHHGQEFPPPFKYRTANLKATGFY
jgi:hypothetical protein